MSEEEFKKLIKFSTDDLGMDRLMRRASIELSRTIEINKNEDHKYDLMKLVDERLTEDLLRRVYTDRREEFYKAIADLHKFPPIGFEYDEAVERILKLAKRQ